MKLNSYFSNANKKIICGALTVAILGIGSYTVYGIHRNHEAYKLHNIKSATDGNLGMYKADSIKNDVDGRIKYEYNVLAFRYQLCKHQYEIVKANIDKFSDNSTNPADAKIFWDAYQTEYTAFYHKLSDKHSECFGGKFRDCQADNIPFSPQDTTTEMEDEVTKIMTELNSPTTMGHMYKEYVKKELLPRYNKILSATYDNMDKLHVKISSM